MLEILLLEGRYIWQMVNDTIRLLSLCYLRDIPKFRMMYYGNKRVRFGSL